MGNVVALHNRNTTVTKELVEKRKDRLSLSKRISSSASQILIAIMFIVGTIIALKVGIPVKNIMKNYSYDVLVILIVMELFTNLIAETGIMQLLAIKIAEVSKGRKRLCLMLFSSMMFLISSCLNNITAVMMVLPIIFVLLKSIEVDKRYVCMFFSTLLAISNTGGAASPIGDLPAVKIMASNITTFLGYLLRAFPLFAITSAVLIVFWGMRVKREHDDGALRELAVKNLKSQYKNIEVRFDVLRWLGVVFVGMFFAWSFVPQTIIPPEMVAVLGYVISMVISSVKEINVEQKMDLKSVLTIASFIFFAEVISQTGILSVIASYLQENIADPKLLVIVIMLITSLVAGLVSAGPAAVAMLPIIVEICNGPLNAQADWIAVAYAAAICAGSSLFMFSATAGFILSSKVNRAKITEEDGVDIQWGVGQYLKYGIINYIIQILIALLAMAIIL